MQSAQWLAGRIVRQLSGQERLSCLEALKESQKGAADLSSRNWQAALNSFTRAHDLFATIPQAAPLLGITKQNIAAALGNLG